MCPATKSETCVYSSIILQGTHLPASFLKPSCPKRKSSGLRLLTNPVLCALLLLWGAPGAAFAQVMWADRANAVPGAEFDSTSREMSVVPADTLRLKLLEIEMEKVRDRLGSTGFWHRIMPKMSCSAGFGISDLIFMDPAYSTTAFFPKDAYRLTLSMSLNEIIDASVHSEAELDLEKLRVEYTQALSEGRRASRMLEQQMKALRGERELLEDEIKMIGDLQEFQEIRFRQGKTGYDAIIRLKLELLSARKNILQIDGRIDETRSRLGK